MSTRDERRMILAMVEDGKITPEEGLGLLKALTELEEDADSTEAEITGLGSGLEAGEIISEVIPEGYVSVRSLEDEPQVLKETLEIPSASIPPDADKWRSWWIYPLWIGVVVTILGGLMMYWAQQSFGIGFWFFCAWLPFSLGLVLMILAWQSRTSRWLHLRVYQKPGEWPRKIAISVPIGWAGWLIRLVKDRIPNEELTSIDTLMQAVDETTSPESPFIIEVDEGEHSERVEIYIG